MTVRGTDTITVLNAIKDNRGNITSWKSTVLRNVHFERCISGQVHTVAREVQRDYFLMIWKGMVDADGLRCVPHNQLAVVEDLDKVFSLECGDYIIPSMCEDVPESGKPLKDFLRTHDVLQITSVESCLYGSSYLQHWEVKAE